MLLIVLFFFFDSAYNYALHKTEYVGPSPPVFSGPHRYMIIAYEQVEPIVEPTVVENRARFELMNWIESIGGEKLLRGPISSVAFISEY